MNHHVRSLAQTVQKNCHISDARHASDYTLCIYLLKMREFYRWEKGLRYEATLDHDDIGQWLSQREGLWDEVDENEFSDLIINGHSFGAFDADAINEQLLPEAYIYSAGYGPNNKPVFFLAELLDQLNQGEYTIYISGAELARDLTAPIAMSQQNNIFIRKESLHRMIWEKTEEWSWHQNKNAMFKAMNLYPFSVDKEQALQQMTEQELSSIVLHEVGEIESSKQLKHWREMVAELPRSQANIMVRAVKDHIADCHSTLPALINNRQEASIHFYFANFTHMRKELAPGLLKAYLKWDESGNYNDLLSTVNQAGEHWYALAEKILATHQQHGSNSHAPIEQLVKETIY